MSYAICEGFVFETPIAILLKESLQSKLQVCYLLLFITQLLPLKSS